jgi:hypothetical protein
MYANSAAEQYAKMMENDEELEFYRDDIDVKSQTD